MATSYKFNGVKENQYPRYFNTPNQKALADKIATLENGETAIIFSSGMAAISTSLLSNLKSGTMLYCKMTYMVVQGILSKKNFQNLELNLALHVVILLKTLKLK